MQIGIVITISKGRPLEKPAPPEPEPPDPRQWVMPSGCVALEQSTTRQWVMPCGVALLEQIEYGGAA